jgi:hypothetical protein
MAINVDLSACSTGSGPSSAEQPESPNRHVRSQITAATRVAVRDRVAKQILRVSKLVVRLATDRAGDLVFLRRQRGDDRRTGGVGGLSVCRPTLGVLSPWSSVPAAS